jgi:hypothetical protein
VSAEQYINRAGQVIHEVDDWQLEYKYRVSCFSFLR